MEELQELMDEIHSWSSATFKNQNEPKPVLHHLIKEVPEVIEAIDQYNAVKCDFDMDVMDISIKHQRVLSEFADCFMLLLDAGSKYGLTIEDFYIASQNKLEVNKKRKWGDPDENGVVEHIRE